ncbi:hypothetical protein EJB05_06033, partial [Eragrostis curvula]
RDDVADARPPRPWSLPLAASTDGTCIVLQANVGEPPALVSFSLAINGATNGVSRALWTSEAFDASSPVALRVQLLVQLLDEAVAFAPSVPCLSANNAVVDLLADDASSEAKLDAEVVSGFVVNGGAAAGTEAFFSLALLLRLFWSCALDAPADSGYLFFRVLGAEIERALGECRPALAVFLRAVGPDVEERFMRSLGYMLAKWCLLREIDQANGSSSAETPPRPRRALIPAAACVSYAAEVHGLWVLRGYAPVLVMPRVTVVALMEAVAQLEYAVRARDRRFLTVSVRVDNVRVRVARLGFRRKHDDNENADEDDDVMMDGERHFPSRIRLWVGPRYGASYATGPSLGLSTGNPERDVETTRVVKGAFFSSSGGAAKLANGNGFSPRVKAKVRSSARTRNRSWRWEQEAEGSAAVFEGVLCDPATGNEVSAWRPPPGFGTGAAAADPRNGMRRRYAGHGRAFSKMRGLVVAGDELPEEVTWRVGREAEGRTLRWRLGLKVWVSYLPNEVRSRHFETRCVEWAHEVDLPLVPVHANDES